MQRRFSRFQLVVLFAAISSTFGVVTGAAQTQREPNAPDQETEESLKRFLQTMSDDKATRFIAAYQDLNADGKPEALVHLISREWCGSGGCNTLILAKAGNSWRVVTNITITQLPIRVLTNKSNGWHNLGIWVEGGGIQPGYEAELRFDGKTYPRNPSGAPARPSIGTAEGRAVLSSSSKETPLFQPR